MATRILIFGGNGQVGQALRHAAMQDGWPKDWTAKFSTRDDCELTDPASLRSCVQDFGPDLIMNASGMANVDDCEKDETLAQQVNFHTVAHMAAHCSEMDIPLIHLSTDYVFDGNHDTPYLEDDAMNPINYYGASKMMGEEALRHALPFHVNLRISSVFSQYSTNILTKALDLINAHDELKFVTDILSAPTPAPAIADTMIEIAKKLLHGKVDGYGTFHYCGAPACSRYDFTKAIMEAFAPYTDRRPTINEAKRADFKTLAERPAYSLMNCDKIKRVYDIDQPDWQSGLTKAIAALYDQKKEN